MLVPQPEGYSRVAVAAGDGARSMKGKTMKWVLDRLREPSTYAGLAGLALAFGINDATWAAISTAVAAVDGHIAWLLRHQGHDDRFGGESSTWRGVFGPLCRSRRG